MELNLLVNIQLYSNGHKPLPFSFLHMYVFYDVFRSIFFPVILRCSYIVLPKYFKSEPMKMFSGALFPCWQNVLGFNNFKRLSTKGGQLISFG